jgi:hypothetical protein
MVEGRSGSECPDHQRLPRSGRPDDAAGCVLILDEWASAPSSCVLAGDAPGSP